MMRQHYYQSNLPHWQPPAGTFFVTYLKLGSIPKQVNEALKTGYQQAILQLEEQHEQSVEKLLVNMPPRHKASNGTNADQKEI